MKQLPDILTSTTFWASIAALGVASGAWFTYVAAELTSRQRDYQGVLSLVEGLEAEFELISQWASGEEGATGYLVKANGELVKEHADWFNPMELLRLHERLDISHRRHNAPTTLNERNGVGAPE